MSSEESDGVASYQGYEYQIQATVWLSLELMLGRHDCHSIVVEPASGEDMSAELKVPPENSVSNIMLNIHEQPIEVQIKLRRTDQWTPAQFREIMRGNRVAVLAGTIGARTRPIQQLLAHQTARFVLLTNAQVNRELRPFLIGDFGDESSADEIPGDAAPGESEQTAKRAGILHQLHPELLQARIETQLLQAGVPYAQRRPCAAALQEEVRARLLRKKPPMLSREDLAAILRAFGGLPPQEPGEFLVAPSNFGDLSHRLEQEHRLSIVGPPGMGKTLVARELVRQHRTASDEPFQIITAEAGPAIIDQFLEQPGRYLFFLEDPWGQFKLSADADRWATALPKQLPRANADKRFLITSRTAIQNTAFASRVPHELVAAQALLNETHYSAADRRQILERALGGAAPWQRDFAQQHREQILRSLNAPYSLTLFAAMLQRARTEQDVHLEKLIRDCNVEAIGATVAAELQALGRDTIASTIALWAWIMAQGKVNLENTESLRRTIRNGGWTREIDICKLLVFLAEAHWFREHDGDYVAHPSILEGLELVVTAEPALAEEILTALLDGLARQDRGDLAHRIRKELSGRQLPIPARVQEAIDAHLLSSLEEASGYDFAQAFADVATECRSARPLAILARALHSKGTHRRFMDYATWKPPELGDHEIERIKSSPEARAFARKFVTETLSRDTAEPYQSQSLKAFFARFDWDLAADFLAAVEAGLDNDNLFVEPAVEGALSDSDPPYDRVIEAALRSYDGASQWWDGFQETYREARQAEIDADYANHVEEQPQERFAPSEAVLNSTVPLRNRQQGHSWLLQHLRRDDLLDAWAESVTPSTSLQELTAFAEVCPPNRRNVFFKAAEKSKNKQILPAVIQSLLVADANATTGWHVAMLSLTAEELVLAVAAASALPFVRRAELADAVAAARTDDVEDAEQKQTRTIDALLDPAERRVWEATRPPQLTENQLPAQDTEFVRMSLQAIAATSTSDVLAVRAAFRLVKCGENVSDHLPRLLAAEDPEVRANVLRILAVRSDAASRARLAAALTDRDYRCRREAMTWLANGASSTEQSAILALVRDRSAPVRERCAHLIAYYEWDHAQPVLFELLKDQRSREHGVGLFRGQVPNFHVARAAAQALDVFTGRLHVSAVEAVERFLKERRPDRDDPIVHYYALQFLAGVKHQPVLELVSSYLNDDWHVPGVKHEGFPLRYVAAWGLLTQLVADRSVAAWIPMDALYEAARHHDPRLAGPSLIALGLCGHRSSGAILQLCRSGDLPTSRGVALRLGLALANSDAPPELLDLLPNHPIEAILRFSRSSPPPDEPAWTRFLEENPTVQSWIAAIQSCDDVHSVVRFGLHELFGRRFETHFSREDIRTGELPESLPVMNLRSMTGGE